MPQEFFGLPCGQVIKMSRFILSLCSKTAKCFTKITFNDMLYKMLLLYYCFAIHVYVASVVILLEWIWRRKNVTLVLLMANQMPVTCILYKNILPDNYTYLDMSQYFVTDFYSDWNRNWNWLSILKVITSIKSISYLNQWSSHWIVKSFCIQEIYIKYSII